MSANLVELVSTVFERGLGMNAKSILESRQAELGRDTKIAAIQRWAVEFFAGVDDEPMSSSGDVSVGCPAKGWMFEIDFQNSFFKVDCDVYQHGEWQDTEILRFNFADIEVDTIAQALGEHFAAVISGAMFIEV